MLFPEMLYIKSFLLLPQVDVWTRRICTGTKDLAPAAAVRAAPAPALCVSVNLPSSLIPLLAVE